MESKVASTCGLRAASIADKGRLPSSSKSSSWESAAAAASPSSPSPSPLVFAAAGWGFGGGAGFLISGAAPVVVTPGTPAKGYPYGPTGGGILAGWPSEPAPYI